MQTTPASGDHGIDATGYWHKQKIVVQCKRYARHNLVGEPDMQRFLGSIQNARAAKGYFVTTSGFTEPAKVFAQNNGIELIDRTELVNMVTNTLKGQ